MEVARCVFLNFTEKHVEYVLNVILYDNLFFSLGNALTSLNIKWFYVARTTTRRMEWSTIGGFVISDFDLDLQTQIRPHNILFLSSQMCPSINQSYYRI